MWKALKQTRPQNETRPPLFQVVDHRTDVRDIAASFPRGEAQLLISIRARDVPEELKERIESEVAQVLAAQLGEAYEGNLRAAAVSEPESEERAAPVAVSLGGLDLAEPETRRLESDLTDAVAQLLPRDGNGGNGNGGNGNGGNGDGDQPPPPAPPLCICAASGIPGTVMPLQPLIDMIADAQLTPPYSIAFFPTRPVSALRINEDLLLMRVEDGATIAPPLTRTEMLVGFGSNTDWEKQLVAWSLCRGAIASLIKKGRGSGPSFIRVFDRCHETDTLLFRKAKFLGFMTDMYHWDFMRFWDFFGGKCVTFTWAEDNFNNWSSIVLPAPTLLAPANGSEVQAGQTVTFDWTAVSDANEYMLERDGVGDFLSAIPQTVSESRWSTNALARGTVFWRVQALDAWGIPGRWSPIGRLSVV